MKQLQTIFLAIYIILFSACSSDEKDNAVFQSAAPSTLNITLSDATGIVNQYAAVGTLVGKITVTKEGVYPITAMRLYGINAQYFDISIDGTIRVASGANFNFSTKPLYNLEVLATNANEVSNRAKVDITIVNTNFPRLADFSGSIDLNASAGTTVGDINILETGSSPVTVITLSGPQSSDFNVESNGTITLSDTASLDYDETNLYNLEAIATNASGNSIAMDVVIAVKNNASIEQALVLIAISFNDYPIKDTELNWHNKTYGNSYGQINHYYREVSNGRFSIIPAHETSGTTNDGIIKVSLGINHPGNNSFGRNHLIDAINLADPYIDFSQYDKNGDGDISIDELQIMFIVGGGETAYGGADPATSVWAHASGISAPPTVDGVTVMKYGTGGYSRFGEKQGDHFATIGVIVHELGHAMLKLPDLYDRVGNRGGIGYFGLMASGSWAKKYGEQSGETPVHMSAWCKLEAGWITPRVIDRGSSDNNISMHASHSTKNNIIKLTTDDALEYFLIENRSPIGYDAGMYRLDNSDFAGGLAIWHIDENQRDDQNDNASHKLVDLEEANDAELDGTSGADGTIKNLFYLGNSTLFNNASSPNTNMYSGTGTVITVDNISAVGSAEDKYIMYIDITR